MQGWGALVTGGGSGIGLACAKRLAADGASVTICGRTQSRLEEAATIFDTGWVVADVTDEDQVQAAVAAAVLDDYLDQMPVRRIGTVDDVAEAVRYLAGPESSWVTGQTIGVDGGHSLRRGPDYTPFAEPLYGPDALRGLLPE